jgi:hypothetical protein
VTQIPLAFEHTALAVLRHPGFFRIERVHSGHAVDCGAPGSEAWPGMPCWHFDVGVSLVAGMVTWWHGATVSSALDHAVAAIKARGTAHAFTVDPGADDYTRTSINAGCVLCGVARYAHDWPPVLDVVVA